ncbi:MAG: cation transporter [Chloroflexi bacterium]|nr:cation transporter [Chloroflexota bacterium]
MRKTLSTPTGAARLLLITVIGLLCIKIAVGVVTDSVSIWAQAVDSTLDVFAVVITFLTVGFSVKPADQEHPFGHGKVEDIAAGIQALLLLGAAGGIIYAAILRIMDGEVIKLTEAGIAVMAVSMTTSILLSRHLFKVARATGSVALEANANNIKGDIFSTAGVLVGLIVVRLTGMTIFDPIIALIVSLFILRATYQVGRMAWNGLIDVRLPKTEEDMLVSIIKEHSGQLAGFHEVRTRKSGIQRFIDLHLMLPRNASVEEAHKMCDHLEADIAQKLPNANVTIHVEPCSNECDKCLVSPCSMHLINITLPEKRRS